MTLRGTASKRPERIGIVFGGKSVISMRALFGGALADEAFSHPQLPQMTICAIASEGGEQHQSSAESSDLHLINHALLSIHQRRQLGKQHSAYGGQIALALQHAGKPSEVRLEPVLFGVVCRW